MRRLWIDSETRSSIPIKRGTQKYAQDVKVMVITWALDNGPVETIDLMQPSANLTKLCAWALTVDEIWAHYAEFDRTMLATVPAWKALKIPLEKWRCTAALARMHGLPGGLDKLCTIFKLPVSEAKDKRGYELIMLFCVPKKDGSYNDRRSHPKEWAEFLVYAAQDIVSMRACYHKTPKWNSTPRMWALWRLDQRMNERGVAFDIPMAEAAVKITTRTKRRLAGRTAEITENEVESTTQRNRLLAYMSEYGVDLPDLTADTVARRLDDENLPDHIKELLRIRQQASKASTAKYQRVLTHEINGRLCGMIVFCGAFRTLRMAGRLFQPQNLPRPKHHQWEIDLWITLAKLDETDVLTTDDIGLASSSLRSLIVAPDGRKLVSADLKNIEGRVMAWLAGEEWKLEAFRAFDRGDGPDMYKASIARSFGWEIDDFDWDDLIAQWRQIGKVQELALQFYGGVGAFCSMAETYGLHLDKLADAAWPNLPLDVRKRAEADWKRAIKRQRTYGLDERVWITCQTLVLMWRAAHPAICAFWKALQKAVATAIRVPEVPITAGRVVVDRHGSWLRIRLPNGVYLSYPAAQIDQLDDEDMPDSAFTPGASFMGINQYTKQWERISTYSGKVAANVTQATAAQILMDGLLGADAAGYEPELTVHDDILCEPPDDPRFTGDGLAGIICESSLWADGLPLTATSKEMYRNHQ